MLLAPDTFQQRQPAEAGGGLLYGSFGRHGSVPPTPEPIPVPDLVTVSWWGVWWHLVVIVGAAVLIVPGVYCLRQRLVARLRKRHATHGWLSMNDSAGTPAGVTSSVAVGGRGSKDSPAEDKGRGTTAWQTALNVVKCTVGVGSMAIPFVFKLGRNALLTFAIILAVGALSAYTIVLLSKCAQRLARRETTRIGDYQCVEGAQPLLLTYPEVGGKYAFAHTDRLVVPRADVPPSPIAPAAAFPELGFTVCGKRVNALALLIHIIVQVIIIGVCVAFTDFIAATLPAIW
jgi:hypothetical protein